MWYAFSLQNWYDCFFYICILYIIFNGVVFNWLNSDQNIIVINFESEVDSAQFKNLNGLGQAA